MSDLEKIINELNDVLNDNSITPLSAVYDAINFLRTLQPSDNGELVEELKSFRQKFKNRYDQNGEWAKVADCLFKAIAALEAPKPFDVREAMKKKLPIMESGVVWKYRKDTDQYHMGGEENTVTLRINQILYCDWQPYTEPEPTAEQLIEDARIAVMDITADGTVLTRDRLDKIDVALDAFEKLTLETGE